jgi:hypothetical protein
MLRCRPLQQQWHTRLCRTQLQPQRLLSQINEVASQAQSNNHGPVAVYDKLVQEGTVIRDPHQVETMHMLQVRHPIESSLQMSCFRILQVQLPYFACIFFFRLT